MSNSEEPSLLRKASARRKLKLQARRTLGTLGRYVPLSVKLRLARHSSKLAYLLTEDGELILDDYLGCFSLSLNAKYETQRVLFSGGYEPDVLAAVQKYVGEDDYCVDVGANIGAIAFALAKQVGSGGRVFCFEPGPPYAERLRKNISLNPQLEGRVEVFQMGISDREGELIWEEDIEFPGNAGLLGEVGPRVPVTTLDKFLGEIRLPRLRFIKLDIEGMEWEALCGARKVLQQFRPIILYETRLEAEVIRGFPVLKKVEELLISLGYVLHQIDGAGNLSPARYPHYSPNTVALPIKNGA